MKDQHCLQSPIENMADTTFTKDKVNVLYSKSIYKISCSRGAIYIGESQYITTAAVD